jgi:thiol:disulfide interchange protein DsbD
MHSITEFLSQMLAGQPGELTLWQSFLAVILTYLGGVLSSLTPCVYPMIPITVSVVGGMGGQRKSWKSVTLRGFAYVGGMAVIYSLLGVFAGISGKVFGSFTNHSTWYLTLGAVMTIAALVMLEVIQLDFAVWIENWKRKWWNRKKPHEHRPLPSSKQETTILGAFVLGVSSGFIAAPCTTPVLTSILAFIAKTQSVGLGFFLMLSFSLGLGTLLLVVAAFAGAIQILPRSGQWMKTVKIGSGLILLAFADYLIYRAGNCGGP